MNEIIQLLNKLHLHACDDGLAWVTSHFEEEQRDGRDFPDDTLSVARRLWYACPDGGFLLWLATDSDLFYEMTIPIMRLRVMHERKKKPLDPAIVRESIPFGKLAAALDLPRDENLPLPGLEVQS